MALHPLQRHILEIIDRHAGQMAVGYSRKTEDFEFTFGVIFKKAQQLAHLLEQKKASVFAISSDKNEVPSIGILAALLSGKSFVPLNPHWPEQRICELLKSLKIDIVVSSCAKEYGAQVIDPRKIAENSIVFEPTPAKPDDILYIVPTSGTTSDSKLIQITYENAGAYLKNFFNVFKMNVSDRIGHISELNFDVGIGDILWSFYSGASLLPIQSEQLLEVPTLLEKWRATVWSSAPSVAKNIIAFYGQRSFQGTYLKNSFFIGEKLFRSVANSWIQLFPQGEVFNVYGPAETTISVSYYKFDRKDSAEVLPIGTFYDKQDVLLFDNDKKTPSTEQGELLICGNQVMKGYVDSNMNSRCFFQYQNRQWYKTGDLVRKEGANYVFLKRIDAQIKIAGQRFELEEVEERLKACYAGLFIHVIPYFFDDLKNPTGLIGIADKEMTKEEKQILQSELRKTIPSHFVPREFIMLNELPLNASGKLDRQALLEIVIAKIG